MFLKDVKTYIDKDASCKSNMESLCPASVFVHPVIVFIFGIPRSKIPRAGKCDVRLNDGTYNQKSN